MTTLEAYINGLFEERITVLKQRVKKYHQEYLALEATDGKATRRARSRAAQLTMARRRLEKVNVLHIEFLRTSRR